MSILDLQHVLWWMRRGVGCRDVYNLDMLVSVGFYSCPLVPVGAWCRLAPCTTVNEKRWQTQMLNRRLLHGDVGVWWCLFVPFVDWHRVLTIELLNERDVWCTLHRYRFGYVLVVFFSCLFLSVGVCCRLAACTKRGVGCRGCTDVYLEQVGNVQKQLLPPPAANTAPSHHTTSIPVIAPVLAFSEQLVFPVILSLRLFTCHVFSFRRGGVKSPAWQCSGICLACLTLKY